MEHPVYFCIFFNYLGLSKISWDIRLTETRRKGENRIELISGNILYSKGNPDDTKNGVGIIINKRISKHVQTVKRISDRVSYMINKFKEQL